MKRIWVVLFCCIAIGAVTLAAHLLRFSPPPIPPGVSFFGLTDDGDGSVLAQFIITNKSSRPVDYLVGQVQVLSNGFWGPPHFPEGAMSRIAPAQAARFVVPLSGIQGVKRVPVTWCALPTRGDYLLYRAKRRIEFLQRGIWLKNDSGMHVNDYVIFTPVLEK